MLLISSDHHQASNFRITMLSFFTFFVFLTSFFIVYTLRTIFKSNNGVENEKEFIKIQSLPLNDENNATQQKNVTRTLVLQFVPSNSLKWDTIFSKVSEFDVDPDEGTGSGQEEKKRKKKRGKKKSANEEREESLGFYPFTKFSSATQRKIKQQYDQLVKSHESKRLTFDQVGQFVNCLDEARNELQHKSVVITRKFTITKDLLLKADRSSFDRLRQQIYKLELEQKRLEEEAFVYNWLQEQLKASPAYKKMLELGACMEMKEKGISLVESKDEDFPEISFEELLEQEKKDVLWLKNGRFKQSSG